MWLALVLTLVAACTPVRREADGDLVRRIRFEGNGALLSGQNDYQLRTAMGQKSSPTLTFTWPFLYFVSPVPLNSDALRADALRLETWYAHHGWLDARFLGWEIRRVRARYDDRAGVVDVLGHVDPGPRSVFRNVALLGDLNLAARSVVAAARRKVPLEPGAAWELSTVTAAEGAIRDGLQDNGHAYADVHSTSIAQPATREVDVDLHVDPGPIAVFGGIEVVGVERVGASDVLGLLDFEPGDTFSLRKLRESQRRLFETGLFSVVNLDVAPCAQARAAWARAGGIGPPPSCAPLGPIAAAPQPEATDDAAVASSAPAPLPDVAPIRIELNEARFRRFRVGAGAAFDYFTVQPRLDVSFQDLWVAGSKLQLRVDGGFGAIVGVVRDDDGGTSLLFTGDAGVRLDYPWLLRSRLGLSTGIRFRQDAQFGTLPFQSVDADFSLRYRFTRSVSLTFGPRAEYFGYLEPTQETLTAARLQFGGDFGGRTYRLLSLDAQFLVDWRDDPLFTRRGTYWRLAGRQSIPLPIPDGQGGTDPGFLYTKLDGEVRGWRPVRFSRRQTTFPLVLGGRLHGTVLIPWRRDAALPYPDLAFLGGPNSLRGFRANQAGPYDCVCSYRAGRPDPQHANGRETVLTRTYLPQGGALALDAIAEARIDWNYGVSFALFGDVGLLSRRLDDIGVDDLRYGGGVGLRYASPVGPIRLDIGLRPLFPEDSAASSYINCNPLDRLPRGFDLFSGGRRAREMIDQRQIPLAINLFLAIGEAF